MSVLPIRRYEYSFLEPLNNSKEYGVPHDENY